MAKPTDPVAAGSAQPAGPIVTGKAYDVAILGSGAAGLAAALAASAGGASVVILEKSEWLGGTTAMSGAGIWIPANHLARAHGIADSAAEALRYIRAAALPGWEARELRRWHGFVANAPLMLEFLERHTPLRFELTGEPDPFAHLPGGKAVGRMVSPRLLGLRRLGPLRRSLRPGPVPPLFTYAELRRLRPYGTPFASLLRFGPRLLLRLLRRQVGQGHALIGGLLRGCLDRGCTLHLGTRAVELLPDSAGRIVGVVVETDGRRTRHAIGRGIVIATGGFERDPEWMDRYFPGPVDRIVGCPANTGDGQRLALAAGAALAHLDQAVIFPSLRSLQRGGSAGLPLPFQANRHCIVVNRHGQRFGNELALDFYERLNDRDANGAALHLPAWIIADRNAMRTAPLARWLIKSFDQGARSAPGLAELARQIDIPAATLQATVERYNSDVGRGRDTQFFRGESLWDRFEAGPRGGLGTIIDPPFLALPFNLSIFGTKGGARTDAVGAVLRPDGSVIDGLFAAGNAMANPFGTRGYGSGTTIGPCLTWGFICGQQLAAAMNR